MKNKLFLLISLLTLNIVSQNLQIKKLDITNGLPDNSVRDIIQDQKGYLWFGTLNGLSKYDGNNFKNYYSIPGDSTSLSNSRMVKISEDKNGFIWSWADDKNMQRINPITNEVININKRFFNNKTPINFFRIASNGNIWVWGNNSCSKLEYIDNNTDLKITTLNQQNGLVCNKIQFLEEDSLGNIWVGTDTGLIKITSKKNGNLLEVFYKTNKFISLNIQKNTIWFGTQTGKVIKYDLETKEFQFLKELTDNIKNKPIRGINQFNSETLLIVSDKYLFEYNIEKKKSTSIYDDNFNHFDYFFNDAFNNSWIVFKSTRGIYRYSREKKVEYFELNKNERDFLGDQDKHQLLEDSNKNLWVGIHGGGLFFYDRYKIKFINYKSDENNTDSISSDIVLNLFEDSSKNLWVGTMYGGVNKIKLSKENFIWNYPSKIQKNIYENEIRTTVEDEKGNLWLGSKGGKIFWYKNETLKHTFPDDLSAENKYKISNINVYSMLLDHNNNLWIGTKGKGVFIIKNINNTSVKKLEIVHFDTKTLKGLSKVYSIVQDKNKNYWIGSHGNGLGKISDPFSNFKMEIFGDAIISKYIRYLFFDIDDNLWIATSDGINLLRKNQLNASKKSFTPINNSKENKASLSYNSVDHIFQSQDKSIYISTMGGGLNILSYSNLKNNIFEFKHLTKSDGISSDKIFASQEDSENNIWISTSLGINKYYPKKGMFENFFVDKKHNLSYFTEGCVTKLNNENILFGNHKGFVSFNPRLITKDTTQYPIVLSKLFINGNEEIPRKSGFIKKNIEYEKEINLTYKQNTIRLDFSVLDFKNPEKIQYSYKLDNFDANWTKPLTNNTAIFQNLPHGNYNFMLKATNSDGIQLSNILMFKINIAPPFFKSYLGYFIEFVVFSILFFSFLYLYKKQISSKQEVLFTEKLNEKKLVYYTNISHEFKTPLTLISCHLQDIINDKSITIKKAKSITKEVQKSSSYLLNLVEQILDFRKIREEKMKLFLININIIDFLKNIYLEFIPLATKDGIDLKFESNTQEFYGYIDIRILKKIIYNLLSNAIKFTPSAKSISLSIKLDEKFQFIKIKIKDEGKGISEEDQKHLFERFSKSENSSGLGLFYVKELIDCHKGTIDVKSDLNIGTCFTVCIPIDKNYYSNENIEVDVLPKNEENLIETEFINKTENINGITNSILIIEDNNEMRRYLNNKFKSIYKVFTAQNGKEGIELAIKETPDLILCDLMMPAMDGIETIKTIRGNFNTCHIPIILLTANSSEHKKFEGIKIGADDYINKPFNVEHLELKVNSLISQRKKIIKSFSKNPELSVNILTNTKEDKIFILKVKKVIEESMGEPNFSINTTASKLGLSRTVFYKKMKEITGETPNEFIGSMQMKKAALLLKNTNYPTSEISLICGFNDIRYFAKIFKKHFKLSPKEYQIKHKNDL